MHPYQNVYFNRLAGKDMQMIKQRFDLDYWGLAYREGLAYILSVDDRETIPVYADTPAGVRSAAILGRGWRAPSAFCLMIQPKPIIFWAITAGIPKTTRPGQ